MQEEMEKIKLSLSDFIQSLTPEQRSVLRADAEKRLAYWMTLAQLRDETGLPIDIIYLRLQEGNQLPTVVSDGIMRPVSNREFEEGIGFCVQIRQCGGLAVVMKALEN